MYIASETFPVKVKRDGRQQRALVQFRQALESKPWWIYRDVVDGNVGSSKLQREQE